MFDRDILVAHLLCLFLRLVERVVQTLGNVNLLRIRAPAVGRQRFHFPAQIGCQRRKVDPHAGKQTGNQPVRLFEQRAEQMQLRNFGISPIVCALLRRLYGFYAFLC
ncbi:hypothetical protein SDC9_78415 [bioreactor metagenome]|uniref:Uncharacterized protein n=1 Tax=bioreactor metagenome TaxID=1076179 RepID=A0A644YV41_9ZZZZ